MRYDEYLREGYPIASKGIEGACRHLVKDRLETIGETNRTGSLMPDLVEYICEWGLRLIR